MKTHHRNYPFRPPRKRRGRPSGSLELYLWFVRKYLGPRKWAMIFCLLLVGVNACSVYLVAFYGRVVVDRVLVVRTAEVRESGPTQAVSPSARDRTGRQRSLPRTGFGRRMDSGVSLSLRPPGAGRTLLGMFVLYMSTLIFLNLSIRLARRTQIRISQGIIASLRDDLHKKILDLSLSYHSRYDPGQLLSRIVSDVGVLRKQLVNTLLVVTRSVAMIIVGGIILWLADWRMVLIALATCPAYAYLYRKIRPSIKELSRELRHTNSCLFGLGSQKIDSMKAIHAYGRRGLEKLHFHRLTSCFLRDSLSRQRLGAALSGGAGLISSAGTISVFVLGAKLVLSGDMTLGKMIFVHSSTAALFRPVRQLAKLNVIFHRLLVIMQRLADILEHPVEIADDPEAVDFPYPLRKGIRLERLEFCYETEDDGEQSDDPEVLRNISLFIPAGSWLCIMGPSGCGKSTLVNLLSRLYEPTSGGIMFDGIPLPKIKLESLREHVGYVPQEAQIFRGTVKENICYGFPDAGPEDIMSAARAAEIHDFVLKMKVQYETLIGQKGASLSGGQRQRLSLARALITNPEVLILDDCTSALDADTEERIQNTLSRVLGGRTAVIVSQRVSMAKRCHRICTLEDGIVSEYGTHEELLASGGFYAKLYNQQTETEGEGPEPGSP